ncbi:MAG: bacillithiol biosynthesis cysteine-adding enzyme BshC [Flavobacteriales bacterium]|nr:bacillithiol biosynthesis cysteine-adding enzyme BshC [Flavobacteriales bacterium]
MTKNAIPYHKTGYFSQLIIDYLAENDNLSSFYNNSYSIEGFEKQISEKQQSEDVREVLVNSLLKQYNGFSISQEVQNNIESLKNSNTYTITTGHQLNLFTGPLYFIYKIITVVNLTKELKQKFPENNFVPVFWMATEDHDFEEINHFYLFNQKHEITKSKEGAVGRMKLDNIESIFSQLDETLKGRTGLEDVLALLKKHYKSSNTYSQAIRGLVNELYGKYGLVIVDGDDKSLKSLFVNSMKQELIEQQNIATINKTSTQLENLGYSAQVTPREINLFYIEDGLRERIVFEDGVYKVLNTSLVFSKDEIIEELSNHPDKFSPNVVMRPLYQETILPNLAYIGGGGEIAYWLQLKEMFHQNNVTFPILGLRNSGLIIDKNTFQKNEKLGFTVLDLFKHEDDLIKQYIKEGSDIILDLQEEQKCVEEVFNDIVEKAALIDQSLQPMIKAELQKSLKSIQNIENRLVKAEKRKEEVAINQIKNLKEKLFPSGSLQERKENFIYLYLVLGHNFIDQLLETLKPFEKEFTVLSID